MADQIVITEKTSQAKDVRAAIGSRYGMVLPAEGHLFDLLEPEDVVPEWKRWSPVLLRPEGLYGTCPAKGGNKAAKLKAIREALRSAKQVWLATDCDREGQLIGQEILEHYKYRGQVMRVLFTAQDAQTIRQSFERAKPNSEYARLYAAAVARRQADQIYNLSLTRTATVILGKGARGVIGVGRVKTPTLAIVCKRELEIRDFVPVTYFEIVATAMVEGGEFKMRHAPQDRILKRESAEAVVSSARNFEGPLGMRVEEKRQQPPKLHDLPSLQKLCASRFGWTAAKTLEIAQELYDGQGKKIITYPRAEVRYLPENLIGDVPLIVAGLQAGKSFSTIPVPAVPVIRKGKSGSFYDKGLEGASHHAVIPNVNKIESLRDVWARLSSDEKKLFDVIARAYLATVMPDFRYRQTTVTLDVGGFPFKATGRQHIDLGWRAAFPEWQPADEKGDDAQVLPQMRNGETAQLRNPAIEDKETRPPPRYNEGTLIDAMQQAWRFVDDEVLRKRLKEAKGIGTPATRAEIIGGLKRQGFLVVQGKNIVPTEAGLSLFGVLQQADPALVDPGVTAQLECLLDDVVVGKQEMVGAIDAVCDVAQRIIGKLVEGPPGGVSPLAGFAPDSGGGERPPTAAMKRYADSIARQKGIKPPTGYTKSGSVCRAFLEQYAPKKTERVDGKAVGVLEARPPSPAQLSFAESISREKGVAISDEARVNSAVMSEWIDKNQSGKPGKGRRKTGAKKSKPEAAAAKTTKSAKQAPKPKPTTAMVNATGPSSSEKRDAAANTPLRIPYGNKDVAQKLGARYAVGGWYAPPGVDLTEFKSKGWL
ncbi:DNA topoisomerase [uncultured Roseovarius sp.]|uniref:type IA DNA topoisomerase n=1 Tax=uncultured Roseovarius sp. TaxID=293344 RepID=UPI002619B99E|nr:DNA topoisomerase [uncultured Roseovarius sp.]